MCGKTQGVHKHCFQHPNHKSIRIVQMRMWLATGTYKKLRDQRQPQADVPIQKKQINYNRPDMCGKTQGVYKQLHDRSFPAHRWTVIIDLGMQWRPWQQYIPFRPPLQSAFLFLIQRRRRQTYRVVIQLGINGPYCHV